MGSRAGVRATASAGGVHDRREHRLDVVVRSASSIAASAESRTTVRIVPSTGFRTAA